MHAQLALPWHSAGTSTQRCVAPPWATSVTHAVPAPQLAQEVTALHSVTGTHPPQHVLTTSGVCPAGHDGGRLLQRTFEASQANATHCPAVHEATGLGSPSAWHDGMRHWRLHTALAASATGSELHWQQSLTIAQSLAFVHSGAALPEPPTPEPPVPEPPVAVEVGPPPVDEPLLCAPPTEVLSEPPVPPVAPPLALDDVVAVLLVSPSVPPVPEDEHATSAVASSAAATSDFPGSDVVTSELATSAPAGSAVPPSEGACGLRAKRGIDRMLAQSPRAHCALTVRESRACRRASPSSSER